MTPQGSESNGKLIESHQEPCIQEPPTGDLPLKNLKTMEKSNAINNASEKPDTRERSALAKWLGKLLIILTLSSFIFVGLIINALQLILCLTIKLSNDHRWRRLHKLVNGQLVYLLYAQPIYLIYIWPRVDLRVHVHDKQLIEDIKSKFSGIIVANHTYELDWMLCFLLADQLGNIGSYKSFAKDELKWMPVIGWSLWMSDQIYVKRDWNRDKLDLGKKLDELLDYDQTLLGIFAEGTRYTREKYLEAIDYARERKLEPFKYHLFPRTRGFNLTLQHFLLRANSDERSYGKPVRVFNMEIVLPGRPNFKHFLNGSYIKADIYCEEVKINDEVLKEARELKDPEDCSSITKLLQDIFRRKDEIIEDYYENGSFCMPKERYPKSGLYPLKKPYGVGFFWLLFMSLTYGILTYLALNVFIQSYEFWSFIVIVLASGMLMLRRIEKESKPNNLRLSNRNIDGSIEQSKDNCDPKAA